MGESLTRYLRIARPRIRIAPAQASYARVRRVRRPGLLPCYEYVRRVAGRLRAGGTGTPHSCLGRP